MSTSRAAAIEHRWGSRVHLMKPVTIETNQATDAAARLRNASLSGAFIETALQPALYSRVTILAPYATDEPVEAWVVRADGAGVGIEWMEPAVETVVAILNPQRHASVTRAI
jgi:hypothetical protein